MGKKRSHDLFSEVKMAYHNNKYEYAKERIIASPKGFYERDGEARNPFTRDYTRILHSWGFRRLKHKTQVFFQPQNDHICTRLEHALHVASISSTICEQLGLNKDLSSAISIGHDLIL